MSTYHDGSTFTRNGLQFRARIEHDDSTDAPWIEHDGHGPVTDWTRRNKRPGELILNSERGAHRYYDMAEAVKTAKRDGWGHGAPVPGETAGQKAARAALADFEYLRGWCRNYWHFVMVSVGLIMDGNTVASSHYIGGIESTDADTIAERIEELADTLATEAADQLRARAATLAEQAQRVTAAVEAQA